jgi:hypothetical protein
MLPSPNVELDAEPDVDAARIDEAEIVKVLDSYRVEAEEARRSGPNPRDDIWRANWDRYWGRYDHSKKAPWQSKHVMPESPQLVDRWAAAMREALDSGDEWFTPVDEGGQDSPIVPHIRKLMNVVLSRCASTPDGHRADFASVFEDQMKMGALMALCASVQWKEGRKGGWLSIDTVDPREVWYDPQLRNLYRRRRYTQDRHELMALVKRYQDLYNEEAVKNLQDGLAQTDERVDKERSSGSGQGKGGTPGRRTVTIDEWLCDVILPDGTVAASNALVVVANERHIIRGPEANPFWHERDWLVFTPMVAVPLSIYGRTYMEDWADAADAFVEMTNLILDGVFTTTLRAFAVNAHALEDPTQILDGLAPNTLFQLAEDAGVDPRKFMSEIDLGSLPAESFQIWQALKQEMREGAKLSEVSLGQAAPNARTTAFEISTVQQSGSSMIRSMARTIESRFLEPLLQIVWQTTLQEMDFLDYELELGKETAAMFDARREEFSERKIEFRVRGISGLVDRQSKLQRLLQFLQIASQNELLMHQLLQNIDPQTLLLKLFELFGLDPADFKPTEREMMLRQMEQSQQPQGEAGVQPPQ